MVCVCVWRFVQLLKTLHKINSLRVLVQRNINSNFFSVQLVFFSLLFLSFQLKSRFVCVVLVDAISPGGEITREDFSIFMFPFDFQMEIYFIFRSFFFVKRSIKFQITLFVGWFVVGFVRLNYYYSMSCESMVIVIRYYVMMMILFFFYSVAVVVDASHQIKLVVYVRKRNNRTHNS